MTNNLSCDDVPDATFTSAPWADAEASAPFVFINDGTLRGTAQALVGHRMRVPGDARSRGMWGEWLWDGSTLTAEVDPSGFFTLFIYKKGNQIGISPSILQLLAHGADPECDPLSLAVFHRLGFFIGSDTPFRHIRTLTSGCRLVWSAGTSQIEETPPAPRTLDIKRKQAVEAFIELPRTVINRFVASWQGPIVLPLSGGRDSRHILLELAHQRRLPDTCITFHHSGRSLNAEVQAARALTKRVGVRHSILGHPRKRLRDTLRGLLLTQLCADEHAQMMPMHDYLVGSASAAVDGIGGDILTNPDDWAAGFKKLADRGDWWGIARGMVDGHGGVISRPEHRGGAGSIYSPDLEAAAIERIAQAISAYADWPDPYQAFWFYNRTRREISFTATSVMGGAAMVFSPFLDPDFVDLGLSLPWTVTCDQKLHDDAIFRAYPAFADIPFANSFRSRPLSHLRLSRVTNAVDSLRIAAIMSRGSSLSGIRTALAKSPLWRANADIYRLHDQIVSAMAVDQAKKLIDLGAHLSKVAPKGEKVISHVYRDR